MDIKKIISSVSLNTPITKLFDYKKSSIYIKRDDFINYSYGGNKVRIGLEILKDIYLNNKDMLISYGSFDSNLNRVISNMAYDIEIPCHILTSLSEIEIACIENRVPTQNELLAKSFNAVRSICKRSEVKNSLENIYNSYLEKGYRPYYVYGDFEGKGNENILNRAYENAYREINEYSIVNNINFESIFLAYGTGSSFNGLCSGRDKAFNAERQAVYGVSIARKNIKAVYENAYIIDKYSYGGYAKYDKNLEDRIYEINNEEKLFLDPVYTGKAFLGMLDFINEYDLNGNVLFIHTGAYPIYEDWKRKYENKK